MISNKLFILFYLAALTFYSCSTVKLDKKNQKDIREIKVEEVKIKPKKLKKGDTIGLISPASFLEEGQLDEATKNLKKLGFNVKHSDIINQKYGYLGGTDSARAKDFNNMIADDEVDALFAVRGGYGCARMLDLIDYEMVKKNPKIILGYSDITSLLYAIYAKTNVVCFHGPVGTSTFNDYSLSHFKNILINPHETYKMKNPIEREDQIIIINDGTAEGELVGGNLSIVVSMIGTDYDIDTKGKIIFLEDIGEEPYRIDRMLTQMIQSKKFENCAGVALGVFRNCDVKKDDPEFENSLTLLQVFQDRLGCLDVPVIYGLSFGHLADKFTLPFGINARLDSETKSLTLLEKAVE